MSTAFALDGKPLGSSRYGVIGDGNTIALVGVDGSVDWLCLPRFDSPSVFAKILDAERGGCFRISPRHDGCESRQAYDDATNVLQTLFRRDGDGTLVVTDFMPWNGDPRSRFHELHRLVEVREGSMEIEILFDPRFDYGRGETRVVAAEEGAMAEGPSGERLSVSIGSGVRFEALPGGGARARVIVRSGQRLWCILSWRSKRPERVAAYRPFDHMRATRTFWRKWASRMHYDGPWRHDVLRSALVLKLLQYAPSGAMVAAPTTSLPAGPSGDRNWDYRYSWTRDSAMAIRAMNLIGYPREAQGFFHFVRDTVQQRGDLDIMVSIDGGDVPAEQLLDHLAGHRGRRPVRTGNAARAQTQHDIIGPLLDAASLHEQSGGMIGLRLWREIRGLVNDAIEHATQPDHGIWEPRAAPMHHVHSKLMTWVALDRALHLAPLFGGDRFEKTWHQARARLREEILQRGFDARSETFVSVYDGAHVDATLLLLTIYDFLPTTDPRLERTLKRVVEELGDGKFLRRYRSQDGIDAEEGAFVLCGFWLAEALALSGRLDEALEVFNNHLSAANHLGLLAEEVDATTASPLGNYPQAFSHLGLIHAAARLDLALRLRDEGIDAAPRLPFDTAHAP
ncbi:MAG: glycoside hydrolase family 15 protein [Myxococcales bacterium]|nr:glycoside hydrolase family 15 protein [Myxococcales bacterium]